MRKEHSGGCSSLLHPILSFCRWLTAGSQKGWAAGVSLEWLLHSHGWAWAGKAEGWAHLELSFRAPIRGLSTWLDFPQHRAGFRGAANPEHVPRISIPRHLEGTCRPLLALEITRHFHHTPGYSSHKSTQIQGQSPKTYLSMVKGLK